MKQLIKLDKQFFKHLYNNDELTFDNFILSVVFNYYGDHNKISLNEETAIFIYDTKTAGSNMLISYASDYTERRNRREFYILYEKNKKGALILNHSQFELIKDSVEYEVVDTSILKLHARESERKKYKYIKQ